MCNHVEILEQDKNEKYLCLKGQGDFFDGNFIKEEEGYKNRPEDFPL